MVHAKFDEDPSRDISIRIKTHRFLWLSNISWTQKWNKLDKYEQVNERESSAKLNYIKI